MTVYTVRPNADLPNTGSGFQTLGGNTTGLWAALADDSDSTGVIKASTSVGTYKMSFDYPWSYPLNDNTRVRYVRVRARASAPLSSSKYDVQLGTSINGTTSYSQPLAIRGQYTSPVTFYGGWYTFAPDGNAWNQTRLESLITRITEYGENTGTVDAISLIELYVDVSIATKPTVTIANPSTTASSYLNFYWTSTMNDGDTQEYYQAKIFTSAQYGATGFDPAISTAFWDSGETASSDSGTTSSTLLPNGTYKIYLKVGKTIGGSIFYSDWTSSSAFTMAVSTPTTPSLTASYSSSTNSVSLSATGALYASGTQVFEFQRSDDSGTTWFDVTNGGAIKPTSGSYVGTLSDYEAPRGNTAYYRVRSIGTIGGNTFVSAWSSSSTVSVTNDKTWWFKPMSYPAYNLGGLRVGNGISETIVETTGVFRPLGRTNPLVVAGSIYKNDGNYQISVISDTEWTALQKIVNAQSIVLVQDPYGTQKYVRFTSRSLDLGGTSARRVRNVKIDYIEVVP